MVHGESKSCSVHALIHESAALILRSFFGLIGIRPVYRAELLAIRVGLPEARNLDITQITVGDSAYAICWALGDVVLLGGKMMWLMRSVNYFFVANVSFMCIEMQMRSMFWKNKGAR